MITIRPAQPSDWPMIQRLNVEQNEAQGTNVALPNLFQEDGSLTRNIALAFMVERDGVPVQSFFFEAIPEVCFAGMDAEATAHAQRAIDGIAFLLRAMGFTGINCKVPAHMGMHIGPPLERAGFQDDNELVHFFKDLRLPSAVTESE